MPTVPLPVATSEVVILDAGLSNALEERGHTLGGDLWTARLLRDAPEEIAAVHRTYFEAGAQVATTASYQASVPGFEALGMSRADAEGLLRRSVRLARDVVDELAAQDPAGTQVRRLVAASVGPYGAYLADGSEYTGRYGVPTAALRDFHGPRLELLAGEAPDLLAVETVPDVEEAAVLVDLVGDLGVPAWLSYSASGTTTRAGQPLADAFALAADCPAVVAVGVNCLDPADALPAVRLAAASGLPAVCYPNSGEGWSAGTGEEPGRWTGEAHFDASAAREWVEAGARYVGGCCRVGPDAVAALARLLG